MIIVTQINYFTRDYQLVFFLILLFLLNQMKFSCEKSQCPIGNLLVIDSFFAFWDSRIFQAHKDFLPCTWNQPFLQQSLCLSGSLCSFCIIFSCIYHCGDMLLRNYISEVLFQCILELFLFAISEHHFLYMQIFRIDFRTL